MGKRKPADLQDQTRQAYHACGQCMPAFLTADTPQDTLQRKCKLVFSSRRLPVLSEQRMDMPAISSTADMRATMAPSLARRAAPRASVTLRHSHHNQLRVCWQQGIPTCSATMAPSLARRAAPRASVTLRHSHHNQLRVCWQQGIPTCSATMAPSLARRAAPRASVILRHSHHDQLHVCWQQGIPGCSATMAPSLARRAAPRARVTLQYCFISCLPAKKPAAASRTAMQVGEPGLHARAVECSAAGSDMFV